MATKRKRGSQSSGGPNKKRKPNKINNKIQITSKQNKDEEDIVTDLISDNTITIDETTSTKNTDVAQNKIVGVSSNWKKLQNTLLAEQKKKNPNYVQRKKTEGSSTIQKEVSNDEEDKKNKAIDIKPWTIRYSLPKKSLTPTSDSFQVTKVIGLDCEMVGVGPKGFDSVRGRVTIINSFGNILYDKISKTIEEVSDYRTEFSGLKKEDIETKGVDFKIIQKEVAELIKDRIVVGHGLKNDFSAMMISHPFFLIRDTARYRPFQRDRGRPHALRFLVKKHFGINIQSGEHDPAEDARAAMLLYQHVKVEWENHLKSKSKFKKKKKKKAITAPTTQT